jgi:hypothetical protein
LTFVPDANESGDDNAVFNFTVSDGTNWSASAAATVDVTPVADAPSLSVTYHPVAPGIPGGYWRFDENTGTTTHNELDDTTGNLTGGPTWVADGHTNSALSFDGVDDYVALEVPYTDQLGGSATLSAWIKTTADGTQFGGNDIGWNRACIIGNEQYNEQNDLQWGWLDDNGRLNISVSDVRGAQSTDPINDGAWHHVVMTRDAGTGVTRMYVDGTLNDTATSVAGTITDLGLEGFGVNVFDTTTPTEDYNRYLEAELDNIRVFDRVLTAEEVAIINTYETRAGDPYVMAGYEGDVLSFSIDADLADTDGSETLTVEIHDVPLGATVSDGTFSDVGPVIDVTAWDLAHLTFTHGEVHGTTTYQVDVVATSTESDGSTASTTRSLDIEILNSDPGATTTVTVGDGDASSWDSVNVYGFLESNVADPKPFMAGDKLDLGSLTAAALADATIGTALGVDSGAVGDTVLDFKADDKKGDKAESLVVELDAMSDSATITLDGWDGTDRVAWEAFTEDGTSVGSGLYTDNGTEFTIDSASGISDSFQYVAFTAANDDKSGSFTIEEISYDVPVTPTITGTDSADLIVGSDTAEVIDAGNGDDTIVFDETDISVDGGAGDDTLLISQNAPLDFSAVANIEKLDLNDAAAQPEVSLNLDNVLDMTDGDNILEVTGGDGDEITFEGVVGAGGEWTHVGSGLFTHSNGTDQVQIVNVDDPENMVKIYTDDGTEIT